MDAELQLNGRAIIKGDKITFEFAVTDDDQNVVTHLQNETALEKIEKNQLFGASPETLASSAIWSLLLKELLSTAGSALIASIKKVIQEKVKDKLNDKVNDIKDKIFSSPYNQEFKKPLNKNAEMKALFDDRGVMKIGPFKVPFNEWVSITTTPCNGVECRCHFDKDRSFGSKNKKSKKKHRK